MAILGYNEILVLFYFKEVIKIEDIELWHGDCLELMKDIPDKSVDMILCDLPYGTTDCKWDNIIPFDLLWEEYNRITKEASPILLFGTEPFSSYIRMSNVKDFRYDLYWHKTLCSNFTMGKKQPFFKVETISIFYKKSPTYNPIMRKGKPYEVKESHIEQKGMQQKYHFAKKADIKNKGTRYPDNLLEFNSLGSGKLHPTQKPVPLCEYLIKTYTNEGETVLDNCMGSGTTGVACKNLNRKFIGIELDGAYYEIAKNRINGVPETT